MLAIYKRECKAYFTSLLTYFFLAAFYLAEGFTFFMLYKSGSIAVYAIPFVYPLYLAVFLTPLLTMRTISEDKRQKVDQVLLTAPVSVWSIVMGKFLSCLSIFALAYAPTFIFQIIASYHANAFWGLYAYSIFGTLLLGALLIAVGIFISSLTESTSFAAVLNIGLNIILMFITSIAVDIVKNESVAKVVSKLALFDRYEAFSQSILKISDIVFFASVTFLFIFLTVRMVERRRWA